MKILQKTIFSLTIITSFLLLGCGSGDDSTENNDDVVIFKSTNAIQCEHSGESLAQSEASLAAEGIDVIDSYCGIDNNVVVLDVCGAPTIDINLHRIRRVNLMDAEGMDYFDVAILANEATTTGYEIVDCEN